MRVLVTGGAGYVGSHVVKALLRHGDEVVVFDNLSQGRRELVLADVFVHGDLLDPAAVRAVFAAHRFDAVLHCAAETSPTRSLADPAACYRQNVVASRNLLSEAIARGVRDFVFSSSASVYGDPLRLPIREDDPKNPKTPYGRSKWLFEQFLEQAAASGVRSVSLRYFNVAGADPELEIGEWHDPETHLIALALEVALGRRERFELFGVDYDTRDGTCVRDFVHVSDLAEAHITTLDRLRRGLPGGPYNLGSGVGHSVREVVDACRRITGRPIPTVESPRRRGDPATLVADASRAKADLAWDPRRSDLDSMIGTAWAWFSKRERLIRRASA
ncbi:MAG: UDP-glucose 4-epimerase GalE [Candidatus Bipolaricaulia bacterium]